MFWRGLTYFGQGLLIAFIGVLFISASILIKEYFTALVLTTVGIVFFVGGLYMALIGMDRQARELEPPVGERDN